MLRRALVTSAIALLVPLACADDEGPIPSAVTTPTGTPTTPTTTPTSTTPTPTTQATLVAGGAKVVVVAAPFEVRLERGADVLLRFGAEAFQMGEVAAIEAKRNYDPYGLYTKVGLFKEPDGLAWRSVESAELGATTASSAAVKLKFAGGHEATLTLTVRGEGSVDALWKPVDAARIGYLRVRPQVDATEAFYGLGEYFDQVNHRGKLRAMQIEIDSSIDSGYNEVHVPIPFVIGTRGWGLFIDSRRPAVFDLATQADDRIEAAFGTGQGSSEGLRLHLFEATRPLDITRLYYDVTGYPRLPARWALGPWVWRDENKDQAEVESDIEKIRSLDLATTGLWIDRPYATAVNTFDFAPDQFPDPDAMIAKLHANGLRTALWHTPYLDEKDAATQADIAEAKNASYYPLTIGPILNKWGTPIDLTNPDAYSWWQERIKRYQAMGIEGYKLDYGEDIVPGIGSVRAGWSFADGSDDQTAHNTFQIPYHQVYAETLPQDGGFLLCRHAVHGDQKNGPIIWPGDLEASFDRHRDKVTGKDGKPFTTVGGLIASMIAGLSLGPSGFPFYGADTGGYRNSPPDKELFIRWFEQTALSSVMQIGTSTNTVAWDFDSGPGFDQEMLDLYRVYTRLHLRLWPYEWTLAQQIATTGYPLQRPLGLAHPELNEHPSDEYLFGNDLLVAPVLDRGATSRSVLFPAGRWVDWWSGEVLDIPPGGERRDVSAPLGTLPLYLRAGGIIPLLRPTIDTMAPTTLPEQVDSYATTPGVLHARIFLGDAPTSLTLFDGASLATSGSTTAPTLTLQPGSEFSLGMQLELLSFGAAPAQVLDGSAPLAKAASLEALTSAEQGWFMDAQGSLHIKVKSGAHTLKVSP